MIHDSDLSQQQDAGPSQIRSLSISWQSFGSIIKTSRRKSGSKIRETKKQLRVAELRLIPARASIAHVRWRLSNRVLRVSEPHVVFSASLRDPKQRSLPRSTALKEDYKGRIVFQDFILLL